MYVKEGPPTLPLSLKLQRMQKFRKISACAPRRVAELKNGYDPKT